MTMTEIRGRVKLEIRDKELENEVQSQLAYRSPREVFISGTFDYIECPTCGHEFESIEDISTYCPDCGQRLYTEVTT